LGGIPFVAFSWEGKSGQSDIETRGIPSGVRQESGVHCPRDHHVAGGTFVCQSGFGEASSDEASAEAPVEAFGNTPRGLRRAAQNAAPAGK
jgi:hypothetical protein